MTTPPLYASSRSASGRSRGVGLLAPALAATTSVATLGVGVAPAAGGVPPVELSGWS